MKNKNIHDENIMLLMRDVKNFEEEQLSDERLHQNKANIIYKISNMKNQNNSYGIVHRLSLVASIVFIVSLVITLYSSNGFQQILYNGNGELSFIDVVTESLFPIIYDDFENNQYELDTNLFNEASEKLYLSVDSHYLLSEMEFDLDYNQDTEINYIDTIISDYESYFNY